MNAIKPVARQDCFGNPTFATAIAGLQIAMETSLERRDDLVADPAIRGAGSSQLRWPCPSIERFPDELGLALVRTLTSLEVSSLLCVLQTRCPWLYQESDYPPARRALDEVSRWIDGDTSFDGGLRAELASLPALVAVTFWVGRCCAGLPYANLVPPREPFYFAICKYGVLHVEHYDATFRARFEQAATDAGFVTTRDCHNQFDDNAAIAGRRLKM